MEAVTGTSLKWSLLTVAAQVRSWQAVLRPGPRAALFFLASLRNQLDLAASSRSFPVSAAVLSLGSP
jgi:hypothetical protein